ncbi:MAG: helix-turn-helix transcriptional regulator [Erysipelothrix sp.]
MILADKIIKHRKQLGYSQEELADKLGVSRQAVSKWESTLSIPDLDKIIKMSQLFGVSTDYLVLDDVEEATPSVEDDDLTPTLNLDETNRYMDTVARAAIKIAFGVLLCIISPIPLIVLTSMVENGSIHITEDVASGIGLIFLIVVVVIAVAHFIYYGRQLNEYEYLDQEPFNLAYGVEGIVKQRKKSFEHKYRITLITGIGLCILSVLPIFFSMMLGVSDDEYYIGVALLLILVSIGVSFIIKASMVYGSYQKLLQEGDYQRVKKTKRKKMDRISGAYWCTITAIYLAVSFLTFAWHITWVIWVVAGVLYGAIEALFGED